MTLDTFNVSHLHLYRPALFVFLKGTSKLELPYPSSLNTNQRRENTLSPQKIYESPQPLMPISHPNL